MKCTIKRPVEVNVRYLIAVLPTRALDQLFYDLMFEEGSLDWCGKQYTNISNLVNDYPSLFISKDKDYYLRLQIDIDTKKVVNWPKDCPLDFYDIKIVDEGEYTLLDDKEEVIVKYQGYVPECIGEGGYGDYLEFEIDRDCNIPEWKFTQEHLDEFMRESGNELYENM